MPNLFHLQTAMDGDLPIDSHLSIKIINIVKICSTAMNKEGYNKENIFIFNKMYHYKHRQLYWPYQFYKQD